MKTRTPMVFAALASVAVAAAGLAAFGPLPGQAQHAHGHGHGHSAAGTTAETESTRAYRAINDHMHAAMAITFTGDADVDFMRGMIPHHEAAVAMAEVVLAHGSDPQVRALAEAIIANQVHEIEFMEQWLANR